MSIITVYSFRYHDQEQGLDTLGEGKVTQDKITKNGWMIIESSAEDIDSSLLTTTGRYYPPQSNFEA
ncbi:hypothetical protein [Dechloromonas denitrificans]|uniref:hypothetical protein n=1 Tax=Dechloromonas denitrificans TaxID=281362 RepID=UPI001CF894B3|nr:hypothetical protein [Dechloromonas denitrificans]UCV02451.1 hypothetical protein KI611_15360 [Dechloromonas denitrificans]